MTVFFDFDGTLVDVKAKYYKIYTDFMEMNAGKHLDANTYWDIKTQMASNEFICEQSGLDITCGQLLKEFTKSNIEKAEYLDYDVLFDDVLEVLKYLRQKKIGVNILSMRRNEPALAVQVDKLGLMPFIDKIYTPHAILGAKIVEGDSFSKGHAMTQVGLSSETGALIGDTGTDINSAKHLGWKSIGVLTGLRNKNELEKYHPDYIIDRLIDLKNII